MWEEVDMVPNDPIGWMDQDGPIFVSNGHHCDRLQITIVSDDRSHYYDQFAADIVSIGQNFIRFWSVQSSPSILISILILILIINSNISIDIHINSNIDVIINININIKLMLILILIFMLK